MNPISFKRHRFPSVIIGRAVWLYARFTLSFQDVEEMLIERGIGVSNETVRRWFLIFGEPIEANLSRGSPCGAAPAGSDWPETVRNSRCWIPAVVIVPIRS